VTGLGAASPRRIQSERADPTAQTASDIAE